jgi:hypothetical protein
MRLALTRGRLASAALAASMVAVGLVGLAQSSQAASTYSITPKTGPGGAGAPAKVVTITGTGFKNATGVVQPDAVVYVALGTACASSGAGVTAVTAFTVPTATQVVVTMPTAIPLGTSNAKKDYTICVYKTTTLLGSGKYTVYPVPTITNAATAMAPIKGTVSGGSTVAITGTGFTATSVVKFGTVKATGVKVATDGTSLTAKAPAQAAGTVNVSVTTEGGTNAAPAGGGGVYDDYEYVNAVSVSPTTGDGSNLNTITVTGVGFESLPGTANVYLKNGTAWTTGATGTAVTSFQIVNDTTLVAVLPALATDGAYTVYVVGVPAAGPATAITASATYTVADF